MKPVPSAKKRLRARHDWFCFSLAEKVARILVNKQQSAVKQNQSKREITFDTRLKTALTDLQCFVDRFSFVVSDSLSTKMQRVPQLRFRMI